MVAMFCRPPQRPILPCRSTQQRHQELEDAAGFVRTVGEVAVISCRQSEHSDEVKEAANPNSKPAYASPDREQATKMNDQEPRVKNVEAGLLRD